MNEQFPVLKITFRNGFEKDLKNATIESFGVKGEAFNAKLSTTEIIRVPWEAIKLVAEPQV